MTTATVVCLVGVLWGVDVSEARRAIAEIHLRDTLPLFVCFAVASGLRVVRARALLVTPVPLGSMFVITSVGFSATNVMPLRLGELVRPLLLHDRLGVPAADALSGLVAERVLDVSVLAALLVLLAVTAELPPVVVGGVEVIAAARAAVGGAAAAGLVGLALVAWRGADVLQRLDRGGLVGRGVRLAGDLAGAVRALMQRPRALLVSVVCTAGMWGVAVVAVWVGLGVIVQPTPSLWTAMLTWTGALCAMTVLPTPGFFGPFEGGAATALVVSGVDGDVARTFAVVYHLFAFGWSVGLGLLCAWVAGVDVAAISRRSASRELGG